MYLQKVFKNQIFNIYVKTGFALNNQQWWICHKIKPNPHPKVSPKPSE